MGGEGPIINFALPLPPLPTPLGQDYVFCICVGLTNKTEALRGGGGGCVCAAIPPHLVGLSSWQTLLQPAPSTSGFHEDKSGIVTAKPHSPRLPPPHKGPRPGRWDMVWIVHRSGFHCALRRVSQLLAKVQEVMSSAALGWMGLQEFQVDSVTGGG